MICPKCKKRHPEDSKTIWMHWKARLKMQKSNKELLCGDCGTLQGIAENLRWYAKKIEDGNSGAFDDLWRYLTLIFTKNKDGSLNQQRQSFKEIKE